MTRMLLLLIRDNHRNGCFNMCQSKLYLLGCREKLDLSNCQSGNSTLMIAATLFMRNPHLYPALNTDE